MEFWHLKIAICHWLAASVLQQCCTAVRQCEIFFLWVFHFNKYRGKSKHMGVAVLSQYLFRWKSEEIWLIGSFGCHLETHMDCSEVISERTQYCSILLPIGSVVFSIDCFLVFLVVFEIYRLACRLHPFRLHR